MKYTRIKLIAIILFAIGLQGLHAQEAFTASGGEASGNGGFVSYSIGQVVYNTNIGVLGSVSQGVQQPFEISVVVGMEESIGINLMFSAYPNPTTDFLTLKVDAATRQSLQSMSYQLYDINGKLLENKTVTDVETSVSMREFTSSIYILKISEKSKVIKVFKIIKN